MIVAYLLWNITTANRVTSNMCMEERLLTFDQCNMKVCDGIRLHKEKKEEERGNAQ